MSALVVFGGLVVGIGGVVVFMGPQRFILLLMSTFKKVRRAWLSLKGSSEQKEMEKYVTTGRAWEDYCDTLKAAGATLLAPGAPNTPFDQAEGVRYLTRLVRASLTNFLECKNYDAPAFTSVANGFVQAPVKLGSDNPDNLYENAMVSSRKAYKLTVTRNTVDYLGFSTQSGVYGQPGGLQTVMAIEASDFKIKNGIIDILLAPENFHNADNFLKLDPSVEDGIIIVRQTFKDRTKEAAAELKLEKIADFAYNEKDKKLGEPLLCSTVAKVDVDPNDKFSNKDMLTCDDLVTALNTSGLFVAGASMMFASWANGFQKHINQLPLFDVERSNKVGGDPAIRYYHSYWKLNNDEALVIKVKPPKVFTWNFQVNNHWMESLDYRYFRIHVNMASAVYKKDGSVIVVVTLKNPKESIQRYIQEHGTADFYPYNWLSTTGHTQGTMCWRWIKPEDFSNFPHPEPLVCKFEDLAKHLL